MRLEVEILEYKNKLYLLTTYQCNDFPLYYLIRADSKASAEIITNDILRTHDIPTREIDLFLTSTMVLSCSLKEIKDDKLLELSSFLHNDVWCVVGSYAAYSIFGSYQGFAEWANNL